MGLLTLEVERESTMVRPIDDQHQRPIGLQAIAFRFNTIGPRRRDLQEITLPFGFAFESRALMNRRVFTCVGIEGKRSGRVFAFRCEISRNGDVMLAVVNRNGLGLDHGSTGEVAPIGNQFPGTIQAVMVGGKGRSGKEHQYGGARKESFTQLWSHGSSTAESSKPAAIEASM